MPIQSKDQYEAIVLNGQEYMSFVPAGQEAEYKQYFKKFWEFDEKKSGVTDQGHIIGGWAMFKKNLSDKIGKKSCIAVSYCLMFVLSLCMYIYVFHPCYCLRTTYHPSHPDPHQRAHPPSHPTMTKPSATQPFTHKPLAYQSPHTQPLTIQQPPSPQPHTTSPPNPSPPRPLTPSPLQTSHSTHNPEQGCSIL